MSKKQEELQNDTNHISTTLIMSTLQQLIQVLISLFVGAFSERSGARDHRQGTALDDAAL